MLWAFVGVGVVRTIWYIVMNYCHLTGRFKPRISRNRARGGLFEIIQSLYDFDVSHVTKQK